MTSYLDSLKWDVNGLVAVIVQVSAMKTVSSSAAHGIHSVPCLHLAARLLTPCPMMLQHVDTGELLMQAYADRAALCETLQTG